LACWIGGWFQTEKKIDGPTCRIPQGRGVQIWWPNIFPATVTIVLGETCHNNLVEVKQEFVRRTRRVMMYKAQ